MPMAPAADTETRARARCGPPCELTAGPSCRPQCRHQADMRALRVPTVRGRRVQRPLQTHAWNAHAPAAGSYVWSLQTRGTVRPCRGWIVPAVLTAGANIAPAASKCEALLQTVHAPCPSVAWRVPLRPRAHCSKQCPPTPYWPIAHAHCSDEPADSAPLTAPVAVDTQIAVHTCSPAARRAHHGAPAADTQGQARQLEKKCAPIDSLKEQ